MTLVRDCSAVNVSDQHIKALMRSEGRGRERACAWTRPDRSDACALIRRAPLRCRAP